MWEYVGMSRNEKGLKMAIKEIKKLRDLFTEKHEGKSYFHKDNMVTYKRRVIEGLYEAFYSPVFAIDVNYFEILQEIEKQSLIGKDNILFKNYQKLHARSLSDNIVIPYLDIANSTLTDLILISDPDDCQRIAMKHTKKMPGVPPSFFYFVKTCVCFYS